MTNFKASRMHANILLSIEVKFNHLITAININTAYQQDKLLLQLGELIERELN